MRPLPFLVLLTAPAWLLGQDSSISQKLRTERPEIERLINELQPKEALVRAEAILPAAKPDFEKDPAKMPGMYTSYVNYLALSQAYYVAYKAANAAGQWEKALAYIRKAKEAATENHDTVKVPFQQVADNSRAMVTRIKNTLKENEGYIAELKAKKNPDALDLQQLDLVEKEKQNIGEFEKRAVAFEDFIKAAKADAERYDPFVAFVEKQIQDQASQIEEYKAGKGEKTKWVEAIIANPSTYAAYTDKRDLIGFLYRLNVLDPDNKKVLRQIDVVLGKAAPDPQKKGGKGKTK